jgi:hypothetical protein
VHNAHEPIDEYLPVIHNIDLRMYPPKQSGYGVSRKVLKVTQTYDKRIQGGTFARWSMVEWLNVLANSRLLMHNGWSAIEKKEGLKQLWTSFLLSN